jgi:hypothetical protein
MTHATPENLFVGYALADHTASGHTGYLYFDRYPFFLSAIVNAIIHLSQDLSTKVFLARQFMNAVHVVTLFTAFLLVKRLLHNPYLALGIVLITFSGFTTLTRLILISRHLWAVFCCSTLLPFISRKINTAGNGCISRQS